METVIHFVEDSLINRKFKRTAFIWNKFQFNASLLNTNINLFKKQSWLTANVWMEELLVMHGVYACFTQQKQHKAADVNGCYLELRRFCLILCSCNWRVLSSFTGLGINPTSHPSFTKRPIHQSLLYFCKQKNTENAQVKTFCLLSFESCKPKVQLPSIWLHIHHHCEDLYIVEGLHYISNYTNTFKGKYGCLTSLMCRKSLVSKEIAMPWTGTSSLGPGL